MMSPASAQPSGASRDEGYESKRSIAAKRVSSGCTPSYDLVILDVWSRHRWSDDPAAAAERQADTQVVLIGHGNIESAVRAIKMGAFDFVEKPLSLDKTILVVRNALRQRHLE
jgi:two-component system nitrogen regulation response regulator NtrX